MSKQSTNVPPRGKSKPPPRGTNRGGGRGGGNRRPPKRRSSRSQGRFYGLLVALVIAIVAVVVVVLASSGTTTKKANSHQAAVNWSFNGVKAFGGLGPENVPTELGEQLASPNAGIASATTNSIVAGVQCNAGEKLQYHHHVHLSIFINGQPRSVPLGVGMVPPALVENSARGQFAVGSNTCLFWLHVHAQDGIVHIESPSVRTFLLGQVFGIWNVALSPTQIGTYTGTVTAMVNGQPWSGDPTQIPLDEHTDIALSLGTPVANPPLIDWTGTSL
ncbi:MAG TPA: hypothetical protein VFV02_16740 [Acidimicrobiales bacterium]|nr:hypothetical protein [Acidimicrobiales bacterium]